MCSRPKTGISSFVVSIPHINVHRPREMVQKSYRIVLSAVASLSMVISIFHFVIYGFVPQIARCSDPCYRIASIFPLNILSSAQSLRAWLSESWGSLRIVKGVVVEWMNPCYQSFVGTVTLATPSGGNADWWLKVKFPDSCGNNGYPRAEGHLPFDLQISNVAPKHLIPG
jgi:hypothetical protein